MIFYFNSLGLVFGWDNIWLGPNSRKSRKSKIFDMGHFIFVIGPVNTQINNLEYDVRRLPSELEGDLLQGLRGLRLDPLTHRCRASERNLDKQIYC